MVQEDLIRSMHAALLTVSCLQCFCAGGDDK